MDCDSLPILLVDFHFILSFRRQLSTGNGSEFQPYPEGMALTVRKRNSFAFTNMILPDPAVVLSVSEFQLGGDPLGVIATGEDTLPPGHCGLWR